MESLIVFIVVLALMVFTSWRSEKRQLDLNSQADAAVKSVRRVAKKRAQAASIPMPVHPAWDGDTDVHAITPEVEAQLRKTATNLTPALGVKVVNGTQKS